jgi:hypothetical protein
MYGTMVGVSQRAGVLGGPLEIFGIVGCYAERSTSDVTTVNVTKHFGSEYNCCEPKNINLLLTRFEGELSMNADLL